MTPQEYYELIRSLQEEMFPDLEFDPDKARIHGDGKWDFVMPSYHFKPTHPLITEQIMHDLKINNRKLLDVGCGPAYLEQLMASKLEINPEQITLADISDKYVPQGFRFIRFDMFGEWPTLEDSFDYVIFPGYPIGDDWQTSVEKMYQAFRSAINVLNSPGQIRMNCALGDGPRDDVKVKIESELHNVQMVNLAPLTYILKR